MESISVPSLKRSFPGVEVNGTGHLTKKPYVAAGESPGAILEEAGGALVVKASLMSALHEISEELQFAKKCVERSAGEETIKMTLLNIAKIAASAVGTMPPTPPATVNGTPGIDGQGTATMLETFAPVSGLGLSHVSPPLASQNPTAPITPQSVSKPAAPVESETTPVAKNPVQSTPPVTPSDSKSNKSKPPEPKPKEGIIGPKEPPKLKSDGFAKPAIPTKPALPSPKTEKPSKVEAPKIEERMSREREERILREERAREDRERRDSRARESERSSSKRERSEERRGYDSYTPGAPPRSPRGKGDKYRPEPASTRDWDKGKPPSSRRDPSPRRARSRSPARRDRSPAPSRRGRSRSRSPDRRSERPRSKERAGSKERAAPRKQSPVPSKSSAPPKTSPTPSKSFEPVKPIPTGPAAAKAPAIPTGPGTGTLSSRISMNLSEKLESRLALECTIKCTPMKFSLSSIDLPNLLAGLRLPNLLQIERKGGILYLRLHDAASAQKVASSYRNHLNLAHDLKQALDAVKVSHPADYAPQISKETLKQYEIGARRRLCTTTFRDGGKSVNDKYGEFESAVKKLDGFFSVFKMPGGRVMIGFYGIDQAIKGKATLEKTFPWLSLIFFEERGKDSP